MTQAGQSFKIGGDGGNSFSFDKLGDQVTGLVINSVHVQQNDMDSGEPAFWDNGDKKMMDKVSLQTELRDHPGDLGMREVYLRGSKKPGDGSTLAAVMDALTAAGTPGNLQYGGQLTLAYTSDGVATKRGMNKPKKYQAHYVPPVMTIGGEPAAAPAAAPAVIAPPPIVATPAPTALVVPPVFTPPAALPAAVIPPIETLIPPTAAPAPTPVPAAKPLSPEQVAALQAMGIDTTGMTVAATP